MRKLTQFSKQPHTVARTDDDQNLGAGLADKSTRVTSNELHQMRAVRADFLQLLVINGNGRGHSATPALVMQLRETPVRLDLSEQGRLAVWLGPLSSTTQAMSQLVGITFSAQESGIWHRLKACRNGACLWVFYDNSRNRSGIWCAMQECGNRLKNREYRNRRRS